MFNKQTFILLLCITSLLSACGFQLRGSQSFNLQSDKLIEVKGDNRELQAILTSVLLDNKANVIGANNALESQKANVSVVLEKVSESQTASSFDNAGEVIEFNLQYNVQFSVNEIVYKYSGSEVYDYNRSQLISSEKNKQVALDALQQQAVNYIVRIIAK